jgi:hypothetical protein
VRPLRNADDFAAVAHLANAVMTQLDTVPTVDSVPDSTGPGGPRHFG